MNTRRSPALAATSSLTRRITRLLLVLLLILLLLPASPPIAQAREAQPTAGDTTGFSVALGYDVIDFDPAHVTDTNSLLVAAQIYDTLVRHEPGGSTIQPALAQSWQRNSSAMEWTFTLRPNLKFHDDNPLDASAVALNFLRWWDPANPLHSGSFEYFASYFGGFKGDAECLLFSVVPLNDTQVRLIFTQPVPQLLSYLTNPAFAIASPSSLLAGNLSDHPVGSGPFKFLSRYPSDQINLAANAEYWDGAPLVDTLTFRIIPIEADRLLAIQGGSVHSASDISDETLALVAADANLQVIWRPATSVGYFGINRAKTNLDNPLIRQAILHAVNWQYIFDTYYNIGDQSAGGFLPPVIWGANPTLTYPEYNPTLAQALLGSAGITGFDTTISYRPVYRAYLPDPASTAGAIAQYLDDVNINATVTSYDSGTFLGKLYAGELDLFLLGWGADYLHPDNFYDYHLCNPGNLSFGPIDDTLCASLQSALAEPDFATQVLAYQNLALDIAAQMPFVPMVYPRGGLLIRSDVEGFVASAMGLEEYRTVYFSDAQQTTVNPIVPATITYTDPQAEQTSIEIPAGAVDQPTLLRFEPADPSMLPPELGSANHAFTLEAIRDGEVLDDFAFTQPVTVTISYSDADMTFLDEQTLMLYLWDGSAWVDAATSCDPASTYTRDLVENQLSVPVCHLTEFALLGESWLKTYMPLVRK